MLVTDFNQDSKADVADIDSKQLPLLKASLYCFRWPLLSFVFPRLLLVGFNFAQPFLINRVVQYVNQPIDETNKNDGYGLIGAAILVYIGIAVCLSSMKVRQ